MTQHFVVIGNPIAHSQSPRIHRVFATQAALDISYQRQYCPDSEDSFIAVIEAFFNGGGIGANVTVPFKQIAFACSQARGGLSEHARVAGAVNTLSLNRALLDKGVPATDAIYGDNTDGQGLINHINSLGWSLAEARVAIIGAGGAARGVILPLIEAGITQLTLANRTVSKAQTLVNDLSAASNKIAHHGIQVCTTSDLNGAFDIIINATSIGLTDATLPLSDQLHTRYAYDMMYGKSLPFLTHFEALGAQTSDGYGMLINQAALSFAHWSGQAIDVERAVLALSRTS